LEKGSKAMMVRRDKQLAPLSLMLFLASVFSPNVSVSQGVGEAENCSLDHYEYLTHVDLASFEKTEVPVHGQSTEGGTAEIYRRRGEVAVIRVSFFGEIGKTGMTYYFDHSDSSRLLVELTEYRYTSPISTPLSGIASSSKHLFVVCEGEEPNYPNSADLADIYSRAVHVLDVIRRAN
jgi:hypothetical protein